MKFINVCGYGNTGCTSQVDVLCDYQGVFGVLSPTYHTRDGKSAYHEIGVLKCFHSLGGALVAKINNASLISTRAEIENSLQGLLPSENAKLNFGANAHLEMRALLNKNYGADYLDVVNDTVAHLPAKFDDLSVEALLPKFQLATKTWLEGLVSIINQVDELKFRNGGEKVEVLGLKNDPPGAYPLLATLIPNGITSAILRDPRDTTFDFNRHYKLGQSDQTVQSHCLHYNAQLNSARRHIELFSDVIGDSYFVHDFENLVLSQVHRENYVNKMVGKRDKIRNDFDPIFSQENIGHHVNLSEEHIKYVTENCMDNYLKYREFVGSKGMLLEP